MIDEQTVNNIKQYLVTQANNTESLWQLLQLELDAITHRNGPKLEAHAKDKILILEKVMTIDKQLASLPLAQLQTESAEIAQMLEQIKQKLNNCKQQNDINAHSAHQTQLAVKKVTDILIGSMKSLTYDKKGYSKSGSLFRKGVKA